MNRALWTLAALPVLACGDPPVDDVTTRSLYTPPNGSIQDLALVVPRGRALAFVAQPMNGDETLKVVITLESTDLTVTEAMKTVEMNQFVVLGKGAGSAELRVVDEVGRASQKRFTVEVVP